MSTRKDFVDGSREFAQFIILQAQKQKLSFAQLGAATSSILIGLMREMEPDEKRTILNGIAEDSGATVTKTPAGIA